MDKQRSTKHTHKTKDRETDVRTRKNVNFYLNIIFFFEHVIL